MSVTIKGVTYDTSGVNLSLEWGKYNGNGWAVGNGSADGSYSAAAALANTSVADIASSYPEYWIDMYYPGYPYPVHVCHKNGYGLGWYPEEAMPTAYIDVNFDSGIGTIRYTYGSGGSFPSATKTGYTHTGWVIQGATYAKNQTVEDHWISERAYDGTLEATAVWTANTYTISYNANGGSGAPSSQTKTYGVNLTLSSTKPTRTGYTFLGWATSSSATSATYAAGGTYTANSSATLYAVWKINTYTVSYNANGGSGAPSSQTKTYGVTLTLSSTKPTRTGYTFQGWATSSSGSVAYAAGGSYTANAAVTLYAVWKANTYTVSYNANGGSGAPSSQTKTYGVTLTLSSTKPTRTGYTFQGWGTSASATTVSYAAGAKYTANSAITLYAVWQANTTYTITYNVNGGSSTAPASQSGYSGTTVTVYTKAQCTPTKANTTKTVTLTFDKVESAAVISKSSATVTKTTKYTFTGWNTKANGSGTSYSPGTTITLSKNLTLYAQYSSSTSGSTKLPTGTLDQYVLQGWSKSTTDISLLASPYSPTQSETLYAIWAPNGMGGMLRFTGELDASVGDIVRLVGTKSGANDGLYTVASISTSSGVTTVYFEEDFPENITQDASAFSLEIYGEGTYVPPFDYICEKDNRLWGCSSATRTIYASALGVPDDFEQFNGTADDSYQLAVATPGDFTGCVALTTGVIFTKQHFIHKMLGGYPAEYAMYTYNLDGASYTNGGSTVNVAGSAMYVSEHGVLTYNGSQQTIMSLDLGEDDFQNSKGCYDGEKYFLSATKDDDPVCYMYDSRYGLWLEEDYGGEVTGIVHLRNKNYVLVDGQIYIVNSGKETEGPWEILFKPFIESVSGSYNTSQQIFQKKRYSHIYFRLQLPEGSTFKAEIKADDEDWLTVAEMTGYSDKVTEFPVYTPRCDKLQLRLSGNGRMTLLGMQREYMTGSAR